MSQETQWFHGIGVGGGTQERPTILPLIVWALVIGLVLGAVLYSAKAAAHETQATFSAKDAAGNLIRITLDPCAEAIGWMSLRRAEMRYEGVDYEACWFLLGGTVVILDSNGDATPVPMEAFAKDEPI